MNHLTVDRKFFIEAIVGCLCTVSIASAQLFQMRLVSSAYGWQQQDTVGQVSSHLFGYQTAQFSLAGEQLSFHTYLQGFNDFAGPQKNKGLLRANNFYLKYSKLFDMVDISLGRQAVFAGVGNGTIDGGLVSARLVDTRVKVLGYYGSLPEPSYKLKLIEQPNENSILGGQVVATPVDFGTVSVSYMRKYMKPESYWALRAHDSTYAAQLVEIAPTVDAEEYLSGDVSIDYDILSFYGRYDHDLLMARMSRIQLFTRVKVMEPLALTGEYIHREPRLMYNTIFWVFAYNTLSEYEIGAEYALEKDIQVFGKYGAVSYGEGDNSNRITIGGNTKYISGSIAWNTGYAGQLAAISANAAYPLMDNMLTPTVLVSYAHYKLSESSVLSDAMSIGAGAVYRPMVELSLDAQVQWIANSIYSNDVRLFIRASYFLNQRLDIF